MVCRELSHQFPPIGVDMFRAARMGAFPFTTIEPNVGYATYTATYPPPIVSSATVKQPSRSPSANTHAVSLVVKDVAGLVPGAYQGRGRGNRFLDDLTDADVLVHVLDASGSTDEGGNAVGGGDPCQGLRLCHHCIPFS